jgi:hypothetical protein
VTWASFLTRASVCWTRGAAWRATPTRCSKRVTPRTSPQSKTISFAGPGPSKATRAFASCCWIETRPWSRVSASPINFLRARSIPSPWLSLSSPSSGGRPRDVVGTLDYLVNYVAQSRDWRVARVHTARELSASVNTNWSTPCTPLPAKTSNFKSPTTPHFSAASSSRSATFALTHQPRVDWAHCTTRSPPVETSNPLYNETIKKRNT